MENGTDYFSFEDRLYQPVNTSADEQLAFIDNLRSIQNANNQKIQQDTYNLGTQVPASQGGLTTGATNPDSYFMTRYQTPQVDSQVATLKATAEAARISQALSNYQNQIKNRYNQAYREASKSSSSGGGNTNSNPSASDLAGVDLTSNSEQVNDKNASEVAATASISSDMPWSTMIVDVNYPGGYTVGNDNYVVYKALNKETGKWDTVYRGNDGNYYSL